MWLPLTRRTRWPAFSPTWRRSTSSTQGPAAFTMARAETMRDGAGPITQLGAPDPAVPACGHQRGPCQDPRATNRRIERIENDQPRVIDPAIRIFEAGLELRLECPARKLGRQIEAARFRQQLAATEMIVQHQPEPDHPGRALLLRMRQDEAQRPDDMRRRPEQHLPLDQRFAHQAEFIIFEITQAAVNQLSRTRARPLRQIVLLAQHTLRPRPAASRAIPAPLMPPPTTRRSTGSGRHHA